MNLRYPSHRGRLSYLLFFACLFLFSTLNANPFPNKNSEPSAICSTCNVPDGLYTLNVTTTDATQLWNFALDACSYTTRLREVGTLSWTITGTVTSNAAMITGLSAGKTYEWQVRSNCCDGSFSAYAPLANFTTPQPCLTAAPNGLNTTNITANSAKLAWTLTIGVSNYTLKYRTQGATTWQTINNISANNYTLTGLIAGTTYEYQVFAYGNGCLSAASAITSFTTTSIATCGTPTTPTVVSVTSTNCCVQWGAVSGVCSYNVRCRAVGTTTWSFNQLTSTTQICFPNLTGGTNYECQVAAECCTGVSGTFTSLLTFTTPTVALCAAPINPNATAITATTVQLCWGGSASSTGYKIEYKAPLQATWTSINVTATCATIFGLIPNTFYQYRITSFCAANVMSSPCATASFTTAVAPACDIPTNIVCSGATSTGFIANWPPVPGACSYNIRLRVVGAATWAFTGSLSSNKCTVSNCIAGTNYEFQIQTVCCSGALSDFSAITTCQTTAFCAVPTGLTFSTITNTTAAVNWVAASGVTSYTVQYKLPTATTWTSVSSLSNSTTLFGLTPNTQYQVQIISNCPNNCVSTPSTIGIFTTTNTTSTCDIPTTCVFGNLQATSCTLSWAAVPGACSYIIRVRVLGTTAWAATGYPTKNSATLSGLSPNTTYEWQVQTVCCTNVQSDFCPIQIVSTPNSCPTPINIVATSVTATSANLSWAAITGAVSYTISYKVLNAATWNTLTTTSNPTLIANLIPATTYQFYVQTNCSATLSSASSAICTFTTLAASNCLAPVGLTVQNITTTTATLSWVAVPTACSYKVRYKVKGSLTWTIFTGTANKIDITGLIAGTSYEWNVITTCCDGSSSNASSTIVFQTNKVCLTNDEPCTPTPLTVGTGAWNCINGSNICATGSKLPDPVGCTYSPNDVWYKIIMPPSGFATVAICATPGMSPGVAVYTTNGCSNITYLGCKYVANTGGNVGSVAQISLQGPAGYSVWVRVWGGGSTTGTFSICAIDKVVCPAVAGSATTRGQATDVVIKSENMPISIANQSVTLSPNPTNSFVNVKFDAMTTTSQGKIVIYDLQGKKVIAQDTEIEKGENDIRVSVENIASGMYILRIEGSENFAPTRLMIQK
jgi:hypothetical protein